MEEYELADALFDDDIEDSVRLGLRALASAETDLGVPYPFDRTADIRLLRRIKQKYPQCDVNAMVERFLAYALDVEAWKDPKVRWRSRLWTWAMNDERYRADSDRRRRTRANGARGAHYAAAPGGHGATTETLDRW